VPQTPSERLTDLRNALLSLHKTLLDSEREIYERDIARIATATDFLKLVLYDPWFNWLRELSQLVVMIDEAIDAKEPPDDAMAERFIAQSQELLIPNEEAQGFKKRYFDAIQRDPDVVIAHAKTRKAITNLSPH